MNQERMSQFLNRVHDPFSWRTKPTVFWDESKMEMEYYIDNFRFVTPKEFDFDVYEAPPFHGHDDLVWAMTVESMLYYLPAFMSLVVSDIERSNFLWMTILGTLRSYPPNGRSIGRWLKYSLEQESYTGPQKHYWKSASSTHIRTLRRWFLLNVNQCQNEHIVCMTNKEREIVVEYLDLFEKLHADILGAAPNTAWIHSVRSILRDKTLSHRLGAKNVNDILDLIRLIDIAVQKFPQCFPLQAAQTIKDQLIQEMA